MSAAGKTYLALLHDLPCVVCWFSYAHHVRSDEAHHLESVRGEHSDFATVPLCKECHDTLHRRSRKAFYRSHKLDDVKMLAHTAELVQEHLRQRVE